MGQNIKREIIDNIVVTMSIYISDQDTLAILDSVISSELTKVNLQEICSLPAEWKTDAEQRNAYLIELFKIKKRALKKATLDGYVRSVKHFAEMIGKPLDKADTFDVEWYLAKYEKRPGTKGPRVQNTTYNEEYRIKALEVDDTGSWKVQESDKNSRKDRTVYEFHGGVSYVAVMDKAEPNKLYVKVNVESVKDLILIFCGGHTNGFRKTERTL